MTIEDRINQELPILEDESNSGTIRTICEGHRASFRNGYNFGKLDQKEAILEILDRKMWYSDDIEKAIELIKQMK